MRVVDLNREFDEDILVSQVGLLQPNPSVSFPFLQLGQERTHSSVVNLFSLNAVMNLGDSRKALRLRLPCALRLTS